MQKSEPEKFKDQYRTISHRLKNYDYSLNGAYFITICAKDKEHFFGEIKNGEMCLNSLGKIIHAEWEKTGQIRKDVFVDEFIVMPNHLHGILMINQDDAEKSGATGDVLAKRLYAGHNLKMSQISPAKNSIATIIRFIKRQTTIWARSNTDIHVIWQANYYDRIVRNEDELNRIRKYIIQNPLKWEEDKNIPENIFM